MSMQDRTTTLQQGVERVQEIVTPLNLHFAGAGLLLLVNLYLLVHMAIAWQAARSQDANAVAQQTASLHAAEKAAQPLRGLDGKLSQATSQADLFYDKRLPYSYSQVLAELGSLTDKQNIRLTRVQYAQSPVLANTAGELTEVRMDASLSGDYRSLMLFINGLERDKMFFLISTVTLTGQQSGMVNLRIGLTTYLRPRRSDEPVEKEVANNTSAQEVTP